MKVTNPNDINNIKITKLAIYGASGGGQKVAETFKSFGIEIDCFVDSNEKLWGTEILGLIVYPPNFLAGKKYNIVIASDAGFTTIKEKLKILGLSQSCVLREQVLFPFINEMLQELTSEYKQCENRFIDSNLKNNNRNNVFIELLEGYQLGGVENWSYMVAKGLKGCGIRTEILSKKIVNYPHEWKEVLNDRFAGEYINYKKCIKELVDYIRENLPCTIILNKQQQLFYAGYILKKLYPGKIKIYSVIHSDLDANYERTRYLDNNIDKVICVSKKIKAELNERYSISNDKLYYKESPVFFERREEETIRNYTLDMNLPLRIAYGARLEQVQKRADLIIPLIQELELKKVNYQLEIAGDGSYYSVINQFIIENKLNKKVLLRGNLEHSKMGKFWRKADIFINLSESEGVGISMLEAMFCGTVPIEFDISGSDEFIENDVNGYVIPRCECEMMAKKIQYLSQNRQLLEIMGTKSRRIIETKCNYEEYIDYLVEILN